MLCTVVLLRKIVYVNTLSVSVTVQRRGTRNTEMRVNLNNSIQTINSNKAGQDKTRQGRHMNTRSNE